MRRGWCSLVLILAACGGGSVASVDPVSPPAVRTSGPPVHRAVTCMSGRSWVVETRQVALPAGRVRLTAGETLSRAEGAQAWLDLPARTTHVRRVGDATDRAGWLVAFQGRLVELQVPGASASVTGTLWLLDGAPVLRVEDRLIPAKLEDLRLPARPSDLPAPGLEFELDVPHPWQGLATLSYPVGGLGWQARHRLVTDARLERGDWTAIASIQNTTGWPVQADSLGLWSGDSGPRPFLAAPVRAWSSEMTVEPRPLAHRVRLEVPGGIEMGPSSEVHRNLASWSGLALRTRVETVLHVASTAPSEAIPLRARISVTPPGPSPWFAGAVQVVTPDAGGRPMGHVEAWIPDSPPGQERWLELGEAPEITCRALLEAAIKREDSEQRSWRFHVKNLAPRRWEVAIAFDLSGGDWTRTSGSLGFTEISADRHVWQGSLEPGASRDFRATWSRTRPRQSPRHSD